MNTYNATTRVSPQLKSTIQNTIDQHDKYKNSYFWSSGSNAHNRRANEARFATNHPSYQVQTSQGLIEVNPTYSESCNHCYYSLSITLNGNKKDIRAIKKLLTTSQKV